MKFNEDPTRITTSMDDSDDNDELIEALARATCRKVSR